jgi:hypothetical protein
MKNSLVLAVTLLMIISSLHQPLAAARERRGSKVIVTLTLTRGTVTGELLAVKEDALLIYDHDAGRGQRIELQDIFQVRLVKKSRFWEGVGIGLVSGFVLAVIQPDREGMSYLLAPAFGGLIGGIVGSGNGIDKRFVLAGGAFKNMKDDHELLKCYSRE